MYNSLQRMAEEGENQEPMLSDKQKKEIGKWLLLNSPAGEIQYVAKDVRLILDDDNVYNMAASEAFPLHNKSHMICLQMPGKSEDVLITSFGEIDENAYLDPRTARVASVDHIKQVCTEMRPATDEELPSPYIEDYRCALDAEIMKYVGESYPKGVCSVYCASGKDVEEPGSDFELVAVISAARHSPQNFCSMMMMMGFINLFAFFFFSFSIFSLCASPSTTFVDGRDLVPDTEGNPLEPEVLYYIKMDSDPNSKFDWDLFVLPNRLCFQSSSLRSIQDAKFKFTAVDNETTIYEEDNIQVKTETGKTVFAWIQPDNQSQWYLMAEDNPQEFPDVFRIKKSNGLWNLVLIFNSTAYPVFADKDGAGGVVLCTNNRVVGGMQGISLQFERVK